MPQLMSHADWLKLTYGGMTKPRSTELKKIDDALKAFHNGGGSPALLGGVQGALVKWMQKEGAGWKTSIRNKSRAVETLYSQVTDQPAVKKTGAGMVAISHARDESRAIVRDLFQGRTLQFRKGFMTKMSGNTLAKKAVANNNIRKVANNADVLSGRAISGGIRQAPGAARAAVGMQSGGNAAAARALAQRFLTELVPREILPEVKISLEFAMPGFMAELAKSVTPWVGMATGGAGVLWSSFTMIRAAYRVDEAKINAANSLTVDNPEQALQALIKMLEREADLETAGWAIGCADFGGKLLGLLLDGGTVTNAAIGLTTSAVRMVILIRMIVLDVQEKNKANALLAKGIYDHRIFEACPVMGAYIICCAPTSVMVNSIFDSFYEHGMQDKVEYAVKNHVAPLKEQAQRLVKEHRMFIPELQNSPGVVERNKKKLKEMLKNKGKTAIGQDAISWEDYQD